MVKKLSNVTSLSGNGLRDWLIQRITSVIIAAYIIFLLIFFISHRPLDFLVWQGLFSHLSMRLFSSLFLLSLFWHAWIGMWTIVTDYIKSTVLRLTIEVVIIVALLLYLVWGLAIFWGTSYADILL